ncbi:MAG TPA: PDZ domain-containing protein [Candidatus Acidoferrales bacterium]|nr:PDZ domain-containing protein [Candidatus Acidoferrales bacterium]
MGGLILVPLHVNQGQPCFFVLDSTAPATSIDPNRAAELRIPPGSVELELAGVSVTLADLPHVAKPDFDARFGRPYEGTLGRDFFESFVVAIDYARRTVRLYDPGAFQYTGKGKSLHISFSGDAPVVRAKFNANGKTLEGDFRVDTALDASVLFPEHYAKAHQMLSHFKTIPATDEISDAAAEGAIVGRMRVFQIGPFPVQQAIATFSEQPADRAEKKGGPQLAGEIGGGMLRRFTVIFDYPRMQIIFDTNSEWRTDEFEDMSGITLAASGPGLRTFEVTQVRSGTPGAEAGLQKGDIIAGVDEDPAADLSLAQLRDLFRQPGHPYKLTVERKEQTLHLTMKLKRLLPENLG